MSLFSTFISIFEIYVPQIGSTSIFICYNNDLTYKVTYTNLEDYRIYIFNNILKEVLSTLKTPYEAQKFESSKGYLGFILN